MNKKNRHIYADNAATTELSQKAYESMLPYLLYEYGNASQPYSFSRNSKKALNESRATIAECIGALPEEIYFTSCGTESNNWVIQGAIRQRLPIVTSSIEHHSILRPCSLTKKKQYLPVTNSGMVLPAALEKAISIANNGLVSIMYANNEIGTIQPIQELAYLAHNQGWLFHTDAVQAVGHTHINVKELDIDMLSSSAHKFNGPKGIGFLYIKKGIDWPPLLLGGSQELGHRAGTENIASIVGMSVALRENYISLDRNITHLQTLEDILLTSLKDSGINFHRNGHPEHIAGNLSLSFIDKDGEAILHRLDLLGISISTGSACDSKRTQISHVLKAINLDERRAKGTIRISLGHDNTIEDVKSIVNALVKVINE